MEKERRVNPETTSTCVSDNTDVRDLHYTTRASTPLSPWVTHDHEATPPPPPGLL